MQPGAHSFTEKKKNLKCVFRPAKNCATHSDGCRIRFLTNLSLRVFIFIAFPLGYNILKSRHAMRARFHVFLRSHPEGGCQNSGMIVAPFSSCLSSGKREPVYECAWRPSFLPACARAADAVVRDEDLGSRNPVHREHGARHCIDACVPPGSTTNERTFRRPRRVQGAREALKKPRIGIRGPAGRRPTPPRDDLARHFRERSILTAPSSQMSRLLLILRAGRRHSSLRESVKLGKVALKRR